MALSFDRNAASARDTCTSTQVRYRARFYENYAALQQRTSLEQIKADLAARQPYLDQVVHRFFPDDRRSDIVDLGCGSGALLVALKRAGYSRAIGVEASPDQVGFARQLGVSVVAGDLAGFLRHSPSRAYDAIVAMDVLEHFTKDEIMDILGEIARVLRPGGRLILHVPNAAAIFPARVFWSDFTHETAFTSDGLRQLLTAFAFRSVSFHEDVPMVHGVRSYVRRILWTAFRSFFRLIYIAETGDTADLILSQNLLAVAIKSERHV